MPGPGHPDLSPERPAMSNHKEAYDIAVIGGGPAGSMAAIIASSRGKRVVLIEKNGSLGKKLLMTGKTRCNITNICPVDTFIEKFGKTGPFLRSSLFRFSNEDLMEFFRSKGLEMKAERQGRVFPVTDKASSVLKVLEDALSENKVDIMLDSGIENIKKEGDDFILETAGDKKIRCGKVILAAGGASYKATGSEGDGFRLAKKLGHDVKKLRAGLVPLITRETWVKDLQGLGLENIKITFISKHKKLKSAVGELMFTHFGVSGPLVLDLSGEVTDILEKEKEVMLHIDLKPGLRDEQLESKLLHKFLTKGHSFLKSIMKDILPARMIPVFLMVAKVGPLKTANQITKPERLSIVKLLKGLPLTVTGSLPIEEAMVTDGGVATQEIDPRTMESKIVAGLYFAGEIIDGAAPSGGYNLQQAFSTGYLAGEEASNA